MKPATGRLITLLACLLISGAGYGDSSSTPNWYTVPAPDQSDWSSKRTQKYAGLNREDLGEPQAVIRIPSLGVAAPVYPDSEFMALEAGAAWVTGSARPGTNGNVAIAGHRDSFFRPLENIPIGTPIRLRTANGEQTFNVTDVWIVDALDVSPLAPSDDTVLTLITCHPFRYQGYAPDRYVIRATLVEANFTTSRSGRVDSSAVSGRYGQSLNGVTR